jgi:hypothetical protein
MTEQAEGCTELYMVPWPNKFTEWADSEENFLVMRGYQLYMHEWMMRKGQDTARFSISARHVLEFFGYDAKPADINIRTAPAYEDARIADGKSPLTVKKDFAMHLAAMNHNRKRGRIVAVPYIEMPEGEGRQRRPLTEDEFRALMRLTMPYRRRMFWRLAYWTGHRSRAIETLPWTRIHFDTRTIDFNDPLMRKTNKRRADGFPIPEELFGYLVAAKERHDRLTPLDPYVIGLGPRGKASCTWRGCKEDLRAIGVDELGVCRHAARKLFCSSRIASGQPESLVAALIADNPETMRKHYVKLNTEQLRAAAENRRAA